MAVQRTCPAWFMSGLRPVLGARLSLVPSQGLVPHVTRSGQPWRGPVQSAGDFPDCFVTKMKQEGCGELHISKSCCPTAGRSLSL